MHARPALILLAAASALLSSCGDAGEGRTGIRAVGSSTVYPFAKVVAETFARSYPEYSSPVIEAIGSGAGIALFCSGVGPDTPDFANASRRMKKSEFETCAANGVNAITEIQVGLDGIAFASSRDGITIDLTPEIVYRALAANPYGGEQTAENWSDIDPSLPDLPILVYGPPSTSGTRDALKELVLTVGCEAGPLPEGLSEEDEDRICTEVRADGAFVEQGEQDNLIVQKIESNPNTIGVFGYSYLEENLDKLQGLTMNGVEPTYDNIASFTYPGARPLYVYVKNDHVGAIPGLVEYLQVWRESWTADGPLAKVGLVANPPEKMAEMDAAISSRPALTTADFQ
ncbi:substrate-binding domain-containing protein [Aurantiacibacter suaedae]|uniref:substrate-binding domain-containing protein n=1 Tax=Aurantiacibacter suaedae TaxID=2545755 RepID=UPI0010F6E035|nr:substrate-binding domain-containing protein [Aurantiacibacter suaedae]